MRLRVLPGQERALGLWQGRDATEMQSILESLPPGAWMVVQTTPLTQTRATRRSRRTGSSVRRHSLMSITLVDIPIRRSERRVRRQ